MHLGALPLDQSPTHVPGQISDREVRIMERIGAGGSSIVFKALLLKEKRYVAVKKINVYDRVSCCHAWGGHQPWSSLPSAAKMRSMLVP